MIEYPSLINMGHHPLVGLNCSCSMSKIALASSDSESSDMKGTSAIYLLGGSRFAGCVM
jgi:hypothetical protein